MTTAMDLARAYWAAECRRDVDAVLAYYTRDGVYEDASGIYEGHENIRRFYEASARAYPGLAIDIVGEFQGNDATAIEFDARLTDPSGAVFRVRGVNVVRVAGDQFESVRSYEDAPAPL